MKVEGTPIRTSIVIRVIGFILDYICYMPLTYVVLYCFTMVIILVAGSSAETVFIKILLFALGIKGGDASLNGQDIMRGFFFWWIIIGTILQILKRLFHLDFSKGILVMVSLLAVVGTIALVIKTGSAFVPIILLILFVVNLFIYYVLHRGFSKIEIFLEKI